MQHKKLDRSQWQAFSGIKPEIKEHEVPTKTDIKEQGPTTSWIAAANQG